MPVEFFRILREVLLTLGNGTLNFAAFSARLFLIALERALAFVG
jgi:hypothetical protein